MTHRQRVATWLELAVAPEWRRKTMRVQVHPIGCDEDQCYTLTMDGRCLCTGSGQLTTFRGRPAVERFLRMARVEHFEFGEPEPDLRRYPRGHYCLALGRQNTLCSCDAAGDCEGGLVCERNVVPLAPSQEQAGAPRPN